MGQLWMDDMDATGLSWDQDSHLRSNLVKGLRMESGETSGFSKQELQVLPPTKVVLFLQTIKSTWFWANRVMVLGKKWWKTRPIEVFAHQTCSFLWNKIACSRKSGETRRRILAPGTQTPLASNLCATSPCEKCGERLIEMENPWKSAWNIPRVDDRLWFPVRSIESQTRWALAPWPWSLSYFGLVSAPSCRGGLFVRRGKATHFGMVYTTCLWWFGGWFTIVLTTLLEFWYSMVSGSGETEGMRWCTSIRWFSTDLGPATAQKREQNAPKTLLLGGRPPTLTPGRVWSQISRALLIPAPLRDRLPHIYSASIYFQGSNFWGRIYLPFLTLSDLDVIHFMDLVWV